MTLVHMHIKTALSRVLLTLAMSVTGVQMACAQDSTKIYTKENPLVYEDLWDMSPYAFLDEKGDACGYNIDLMKIILDRLDIPYTIRLRPSDEVFDDIKNRKADLSIAMYAQYHMDQGYFGRSVITLFTQSIAMPKREPEAARDITDLKGSTIYVRPSSYAYSEMVRNGMGRYAVETEDLKSALVKVNEADSGIVLWNTLALNNLVLRYKLNNIKILPINMNHGEYRFLSNDTALLNRMDSVFMQIEMDETLVRLRKKWFYTENVEDDTLTYFYYATSLGALILFVFIVYYVYYRFRERVMRQLLERQSQRLSLYLESGKVRLFSYDVVKREFRTFHAFNQGTNSQETYPVATFAQYFVDKEFAHMMNYINEIAGNKRQEATMKVTLRRTRADSNLYYFELRLKVLRTQDDTPTMILGTLSNLDDETNKAEEVRNAVLKYRMMFNTAVVDMIYCDSDGVILDINEKACDNFGIKDKQRLLDNRFSIGKDVLIYNRDIDLNHRHWSTSLVDIDMFRRDGVCDDLVTRNGKMYYELMIVPIFGGDGKRMGLFITGRDVSDTVEFMHREKVRTKRIQLATDNIRRYVDNINYALQVSQIRLAHYSPTTRSFNLVYDLNRQSMVLSQLRCIVTLAPEYRDDAIKLLLNMDRGRQKRFSMRLKTNVVDGKTGHTVHYQVSGVPTYDSDGNLQQYFCLLRDITELVATEEALQEQTRKAQEAETLKNSFLKNMSYEIRIPLNVVVGFAELFEQEHSVEDELVFSEQIKSNSKKLLYLVNDILLLSRIDAKMIELNLEFIDFIEVFKVRCLMAWSSGLSENVHTIIESQFDKLVVEVDQTQLGYVVETLAKTAARFTDHGSIRTKCDYFNDELVMKFEDTGRGIDDETQKNIFDLERRFEGNVYTSGLELVICHKLVLLMGGNIYVESQLGKGSTFRVTIPCKLREKEKSDGTNTLDFTQL